LGVDPVNYRAIAERVLKVGAEIARRPAVKRNPPDALAIKACIDALDKELEKVEKMADDYRAEFSCTTMLQFPKTTPAAGRSTRPDKRARPVPTRSLGSHPRGESR